VGCLLLREGEKGRGLTYNGREGQERGGRGGERRRRSSWSEWIAAGSPPV